MVINVILILTDAVGVFQHETIVPVNIKKHP